MESKSLTIGVTSEHFSYLESEASERGMAIEEFVARNLPKPPEPPPEEFGFTGVIVVIPQYGLIKVCFDQDKGYGWGFFDPAFLVHTKANERRWLLEGARVKGRAVAPPKHGNMSKILWLNSNEPAFLEQPRSTSLLHALRASFKHLAWARNTKVRESIRKAAIESHKQRFPQPKPAGA